MSTPRTFTCHRCKKQESSPLRRGWDTFRPRSYCPECVGELLDAALAAFKNYANTPQGRAQLKRELA